METGKNGDAADGQSRSASANGGDGSGEEFGYSERGRESECDREEEGRSGAAGLAARLQSIEYVTETALSELSLDALLVELLRRIRKVLSGDTATVLLLTDDRQRLVVRVSSGLEGAGKSQIAVPLGRGVAGRIAATGKPLIVEDTSQVEVISPILQERVKSLIGVPLTVAGRVIGVIYVGSIQPRRFSKDDLRLLQVVAERAAMAIEHWRAEEVRACLAAIVESSEDAIVGKSLEGTITSWNPAATKLYGFAAEEVLGKPISIVVPPDRLDELRSVMERLKRGEEIGLFETVRSRKDGRRLDVSVSISPIRDPDGAIIGAATIARDISERKRTEKERERLLEEVQRRAAELNTTIVSIADGVVIYGPTGEILVMNPAAEKLLGLSPGDQRQSLAERIARLHTETEDGKLFALEEMPILRALRGATVQGAIMVIHPSPGRTTWLSSSAAPIYAADGTILGAVATFTDITRIQELQEERARHILGISHGLRTPLTVIQGQAQLLQRALEKAGLSEQELRSANAILLGARRMSLMLRDLVDLTSLESGQELKLNLEPVDLRCFVLELKERLRGMLDSDRICIEAPRELSPVLADPDRLERILVNLLNNALKYSSPSTEVVIRLARRNGEVETDVIDHGPGIPPEQLPHLFDRWWRWVPSMQRAETLGIGLYITKGIVDAHGGRLWAKSELGKGSTFSFTLSVAAEPPEMG